MWGLVATPGRTQTDRMRDRETIDSELRLIALQRQSAGGALGGQLSSQRVDELLDERLGHRAGPAETKVLSRPSRDVTPRVRNSALRRLAPRALLPLSLLAVGATLLTMFFGRHSQPSAEPAEAAPPPSVSQGEPPAPQSQSPPVDLTDRVFFAVLKQDGVPIPSNEYVTTQAHAVCDFLARQPDLAAAVRFVQQSTVWDADQSAHFAAGAVVSYCPQYETATAPMRPGLENTLSDLQAIQRDMQGIQGDLQGIRDHLPALPGD